MVGAGQGRERPSVLSMPLTGPRRRPMSSVVGGKLLTSQVSLIFGFSEFSGFSTTSMY